MNFDQTNNFDKEPEYEVERKLRLKIKREEWYLQQQLEKEHEKRKLKMIEEYERKRAEALKNERRSSQRSKSSSPQQRKTHSIDSERSKDFETSNYSKDTIIDKKELHKIKVSVHCKSKTKDQTSSEKIERDIVNPDDIILPRRTGEGFCPIFKKINVAQAEEIEESHTVMCIRNEQSVTSRKQLSTDIDNHRYFADEGDQCYRSHTLMRHQDERRITDNYKYNRYRSRSKSKEERNERRNRSHSSHSNYSSYRRRRSPSSHYSNSATSIVKDQSSYRRRSKSSSPIDKYARERKTDNFKNQSSRHLSQSHSSFRSTSKNDPDKSRKRNDRISQCPVQNSEYPGQNLPMNYSPPYPVYSNYLFPEPSHMFGGQAPPIWPIAPRPFPMLYPSFPSHMIRWRMPSPRFDKENRGAYPPR